MLKKKIQNIAFITDNDSKFKLYRNILDLPGLKWMPLQIPNPIETSISIIANKKVKYAMKKATQFPFFLTQSGLIIDVWNELPGGLSRLFFRNLGCDVICKMLNVFKNKKRTARIQTILYYVQDCHSDPLAFCGSLTGSIAAKPRGSGGFGWDRIFIPDGCELTLSELGEEKQKKILANSDPFSGFRQFLFSRESLQQPQKKQISASKKAKRIKEQKISILFLCADPTDVSRLRLGEELREIHEELQQAKLRERFEIHQWLSVRPADLSQAMLEVKPNIVHFSGHGVISGALCIEDQVGKTHPLKPDALAALFEQFADQVACVVLNACYSKAQAKAIAKHIDRVICMKEAISDRAAIAFAVGFYQALGAGKNYDEAYKLGCVQIRLQGVPEHLVPVIIKKK